MDKQYIIDQQTLQQGRINNIKNGRKRELVWSVQNFYGFASNSPQQIINSNVYGSTSVNIIPEGQIMKKSPGAEAIGLYRDIDIFGGYKSMFCGRVNVNRQGSYFFNMIQNSETLKSNFYRLKDDPEKNNQINGLWQKISPNFYQSYTEVNTTGLGMVILFLPFNVEFVTNVRINGNSLDKANFTHIQGSNAIALNNGNNVPVGQAYEIIYQENFLTDVYEFKGYAFDYIEYKGDLYICSGREDYLDKFGNRSGLLRLNLATLEWEAILTGRAAILDLGRNGEKLFGGGAGQLPLDYNGDDPALFLHQLEDFNPSIIEEYQDRLLIAGSQANPFQIKQSEHLNPKNFIDNVLGAQVLPATSDDLRKPSIFFANQEIVSLTTFGESVYIGTLSTFEKYDLKQLGDSLVDLKKEDKSTNSGPVSNKACKVFKGGQFYFGSNYQVAPELNLRGLDVKFGLSGNSTVTATPPEKLTFFIDETLRRCDISNSCIGLYKDYVLWSVALCPERDPLRDVDTDEVIRPVDNNLTILYSKLGDTPIYSLLKEVHSNWFSEIGGRGLMYSSCDNGNVYLINENLNYIDNHQNVPQNIDEPFTPEPTEYESIYQTGIIGFNPKQDSPYTKKRAKRFYFSGGFTNNAVINIEAYGIEGQCGEPCCDGLLFEKTIVLQTECPLSDCDCNVTPNLNFFKNTRTITRYFDIPIREISALYTSFFVKMTILSSDFYINEIGGTYIVEDEAMFDNSFRICDDETKTITRDSFIDPTTNNPIALDNCTICNM